MKRWIVRVALRLVPSDWRATVAEDLQDVAEARNRGTAWSAWQAGRAGLRMRSARILDGCRFDLQCAARSLLRARWFTYGAVLTFALGIGVNVAVFTAVDRVLFRELPYESPDEIVVMREVDSAGQPFGTVPALMVAAAQRHHRGFLDLSISGFIRSFSLSRESDDGVPLRLTEATHNTLEVFGVRVMRGRDFTEADEKGKNSVALISFDVWTTRFGAAEDAVGRQLWSGGTPVEIVGVLPRRFIPASNFLDPRSDGFVLGTSANAPPTTSARLAPPYMRLRPEVSIQAAQAELDVLAESVRRELPSQPNAQPTRIHLASLRSVLFDRYTSFLWLIAGAASLVLAIACANLGSLMLVRNRSREHLAATQVALGASAWRLMRAGLIETVLLALAGTAVSLLVIHWTDAAARSILPPVFNRYAASVWDTRVLTFALLTAVACTAVAGAYPSWRIARVDVLGVLQRGNASARSGRLRGGHGLLIVESALSVMLVAGATMTVRSLATLLMTDLGFEPNGLYSVDVSWPRGMEAGARFHQAVQVVDALNSSPGVVAAGGADINPISGARGMRALGPGLRDSSRWQVTGGFFDTMGMRVLSGRQMSAPEVASDAPVGVLSESGLRMVWPEVRPDDAIGRPLRFSGERDRIVVGVVSDVRSSYGASPAPSLYVPLNAKDFRVAQFVVKTAPEAPPVISEIRARPLQAGVAASSVNTRSVEEELRGGLRDQKFRAMLFSAFGIMALALAALGLYAVGAFEVAQRRRELGIRLAIGGSASAVEWLIVRQALVPVMIGIVVGLAGTYWAAEFIQAFLYQVDARDPATLAVVTFVLLSSTGLAAWLPARRAAHLDPAEVLRVQ
jgi:putative ABC transport system permease protein